MHADIEEAACRSHGVLLVLVAPGQFIAGGAGARSDHPIARIVVGNRQAEDNLVGSGALARRTAKLRYPGRFQD